MREKTGPRQARRLWLALVLGAALAACGGGGGGGDSDLARVRVEGPLGQERLSVEADIADDEQSRRDGLKGMESLPPGEGLLIVLPGESEVCISNAEVAFAIDAVFADLAGTVVAVERDVPAGDDTLRCHPDTLQILEVAAGEAVEVEIGDDLSVT